MPPQNSPAMPKAPISFMTVTTLAAYLHINRRLKGDAGRLVDWLLSRDKSPPMDKSLMAVISEMTGIADPRSTVKNLAKRSLIKFSETASTRPDAPLQSALTGLLEKLADGGSALLADTTGLCIASTGFSEKTMVSLPALASKLIGSMEHAGEGLMELMGVEYGLPCLYDIKNKCLLSFIPMDFGDDNRFITVTQGRAMFRGDTFRDLVWVLAGRYGSSPERPSRLNQPEEKNENRCN